MGRYCAFLLLIGSLLGILGGTAFGEPQVLTPTQVDSEFDRRTWRHEHGLPENRVWSLCQTRDGFLWVGTGRGLARFDGREFTVYDHLNTPELTNDVCRTLAEDSEGNLWIATGFALVRKSGNRSTRFASDRELPSAVYPAVCPSRKGGVWAVGPSWIRRIPGGATEAWAQAESALVFRDGGKGGIAEDEAGSLWIANCDGLLRFDPSQGHLEACGADTSFARFPVLGMCQGAPGELWALLAERLAAPNQRTPKVWLTCFKNGRWTRSPETNDSDFRGGAFGQFVAAGAPGVVWFAAPPGGIHRWQDGRIQFLPLPSGDVGDNVLCALQDREGNLWVGLDDGGLQRWTPRKIQTYTVQNGLVHDRAWSICEARDGSVWIGTDGGISQLKDGRFRNFPMPPAAAVSNVRAIVEDHAGTIWFGTMRAVHSIRDGQISRLTLPGAWEESKVRVLQPTRDGALWIGTVRGLTRLQDGQGTKYTTADGLGANEVRAILESKTGDLWVGTLGGGLSRFHQGRWTTLRATDGLSNDNVWALHEDANGVLWIGSEKGLNRLQGGKVTVYSKRDGLPDDLVNCILEDDYGRLWIGHDHGVYWIWKQQLNDFALKKRTNVEAVQYDETDGLISLETNGQKSNPAACKTRDGRLWFPTTRGVAVIDPAKVQADEVAPTVVVEEMRANGKLVFGNRPQEGSSSPADAPATSGTAGLRLPPGGARVLAFRYSANTFVAPEKARFRYRLVGLDDQWIEAGTRREAYFTDLRPGGYQFDLSACNHHGVWQETPAIVAFSVAPFFYQTWGFYIGSGSALALLIALAVGWRVREIREIDRLERINALSEQRKQIARDVHDELGASLTRIAQLSSKARQHLAQPEKIGDVTQRIETIAGEAVDDISGIVWANNPEYDTLEDLIAYLREYAASYFAETPIQIQFDFPETVPVSPVTGMFRRNLVMLVKEALQNVIKHAQASRVGMSVAVREGRLELRVVDNGRGFLVNGAREAGNGLENMRQRASELKGQVEVISSLGQGTTIQVLVPLQV